MTSIRRSSQDLLLNGLYCAELQHRPAPCLGRWQAGSEILGGLERQVFLNLFPSIFPQAGAWSPGWPSA